MEWQSIETAPKDGTSFLATNGRLIEQIWYSLQWGEFVRASYGGTGTSRSNNFTHWMPLPEPPKG